jgi:hypothetical protein
MSEYILDIRGLVGWAKLSGNEYGAIAGAVREERVLVLARVWQEFKEMYPDEAAMLVRDASPRQRTNQADRIAAAALADHLDATFGPYDDGTDWVVAAKAVGDDLVVVTAQPFQAQFYGSVDGCRAISVDELLDRL